MIRCINKNLNLIILYDYKNFRDANITIYSLETKIHISLINSYAPQYIAFFCATHVDLPPIITTNTNLSAPQGATHVDSRTANFGKKYVYNIITL